MSLFFFRQVRFFNPHLEHVSDGVFMELYGNDAKYCGEPAIIFDEVDASVGRSHGVEDVPVRHDGFIAFDQSMFSEVEEVFVLPTLFLIFSLVCTVFAVWVYAIEFFKQLSLVVSVDFHGSSDNWYGSFHPTTAFLEG